MCRRIVIGLVGWLGTATAALAQDGDSVKTKVWEVRGYVKDMQSVTYSTNPDSLVTGNLIHNRVNVRFTPSSHFTGAAEFRNRLFWGEQVRLTPNFADGLRNRNEAANMQWIWFQSESVVLHTTIDRLWLEYREAKWETRLGRQRINWGISTLWNPNDIFNTYNFLDFDYEERPGRDAAKFIYHLSDFSNLEFAGAAADASYASVASVRYTTNRWGYDFQLIGGVFHQTATAGVGWSGNIGNAGFKGEMQWFSAHNDTTSQMNVTMEWDYVFAKGWYADAGLLLNTAGFSTPIDNWGLYNFQLSPRNLMPTKYNTVLTISKQITPLLTVNFTTIYSPGTNLVILLPSFKYNLGQNIDLDVFWQGFYAEQHQQVEPVVHRGYIRFKWSF